ncbi:MAG: hypothetical protein AB8B65_20110 [Kordia sp.]|uniref:hypothetical protein n=1 Tax=Kordia sp. TaxID=1965332 RepID=UPI00385ABA43
MVDKTHAPDSLASIEEFIQLKNESVIATKDGIYFLDTESQKLKKYYQFTKKYVSTINFSKTVDGSKLLVNTSSGQATIALLFQINTSTLHIDWLATHKGALKDATYANAANKIAIGTGYSKAREEMIYEKEPKPAAYYATLFTVNAENGAFESYFEQGESVGNVFFSANDKSIYSVLGWPHVDTFLWNVSNTKEKIGFFGKDQTRFYNGFELNDRYFLTIADNGLYKWDKTNAEVITLMYDGNMNPYDAILQIDENYVIVSYANGTSNPPTVKYFDKNIAITDTVPLETPLHHIHSTDRNFSGITNKDEIYFYNLDTKKIEKIITKAALQQLMMRN